MHSSFKTFKDAQSLSVCRVWLIFNLIQILFTLLSSPPITSIAAKTETVLQLYSKHRQLCTVSGKVRNEENKFAKHFKL